MVKQLQANMGGATRRIQVASWAHQFGKRIVPRGVGRHEFREILSVQGEGHERLEQRRGQDGERDLELGGRRDGHDREEKLRTSKEFFSKANNTLVADKICCDAVNVTCQGRP